MIFKIPSKQAIFWFYESKNSVESENCNLMFHFLSQFIVNILKIEVPAKEYQLAHLCELQPKYSFIFASLFLSTQEITLLLLCYAHWQPD